MVLNICLMYSRTSNFLRIHLIKSVLNMARRIGGICMHYPEMEEPDQLLDDMVRHTSWDQHSSGEVNSRDMYCTVDQELIRDVDVDFNL